MPRWRSRRSRSRPVRIRVLAALGSAVFLATGLWTTAAAPSTRALLSPVSSASSSSRGVTKTGIAVVFPVVSLNSLAGREGFAEDAEYGEQTKAIKLFVKQVNQDGGIHGRRIDPIISGYDPTNETQMRSLCKTWTQGSPAAFAVLDGLGAWTGDNQLCVAQEGHTPFIGAWSTVTNWTKEGSPYLWWTGPDQATILQAVVNWGLGAHLIGGKIKVGVIAGSRASDQVALNRYLLPDLRTAGVDPIVKTIDADPNDTATTGTQSPLVIQQLRSAGVTSIIPLMPFNVFYPVLQAETAQQYFPRLLLSDYESSILSSLGLIPVPYAKALDGQEGVTTETLGGIDDDRPESQGGYDTAVRRCWTVWHKAYPQVPPGNMNDFIEEQGPIADGAKPFISSRRRPKPPDPASIGARLWRQCPGSTTIPGRGPPCSATARTSATDPPSTRWSGCTSTRHHPRCASRARAIRRRPHAGSPSSPGHRCPPADRSRRPRRTARALRSRLSQSARVVSPGT